MRLWPSSEFNTARNYSRGQLELYDKKRIMILSLIISLFFRFLLNDGPSITCNCHFVFQKTLCIAPIENSNINSLRNHFQGNFSWILFLCNSTRLTRFTEHTSWYTWWKIAFYWKNYIKDIFLSYLSTTPTNIGEYKLCIRIIKFWSLIKITCIKSILCPNLFISLSVYKVSK